MTEIEQLRQENARLRAENIHLRHLLKSFGYTIPVADSPKLVDSVVESPKKLDKAAEQERRLRLFMKLFCARLDVYAERWETKDGRSGYSPVCSNLDVYAERWETKDGRSGYSPVCSNRWTSVCTKGKDRNVKCHECDKQSWVPFTKDVAYKHLIVWDERGKTFVAGTYALLEDSSCKFLVFDFDDHDGSHINWQEEAKSLREVCKINGIDMALERSRSGKGAHVWIFSKRKYLPRLPVNLGLCLLTKAQSQ